MSSTFWAFYWTQTAIDMVLSAAAMLGVIAWKRSL